MQSRHHSLQSNTLDKIMTPLTPKTKITTEICISGAIVMMFFTWFTVTDLVNGEISMGSAGLVTVISKEDDPSKYWLYTGLFSLITLVGWFAVGLNFYRIYYKSKESNKPDNSIH